MDFMTFEVAPDTEHPQMQNEGMRYEGFRFRTECRLAGKLYGQPFGVDVAFGDPILGEPEIVTADAVLAFAGVAPPVSLLGETLTKAYPKPRFALIRIPTTVSEPIYSHKKRHLELTSLGQCPHDS